MKVVIGDPSWLCRIGLAQAIAALVGASDVHEAGTSAELHRVLAEHGDASFVFIDDSIVAEGEETLLGQVRQLAPDAAIGVLVGETDRERVLKAIYFGAAGIIQKAADEETVTGTLKALLSGQAAFPRSLLTERPVPAPVRAPTIEPGPDEHELLTPREREVIALIGTGKTVARIAAELELSPHTVRVHVTRIMKKLDLRDRSSLIHYAVKRGEARGEADAPRPLPSLS
ncbi:DNA-binding response regulator [Beijerinckiaceae bacterium RH AL1]|nr:response regulator transcription factor [Beijerinckiaceae bacterium]VVB46896.1 DNA-binding response regulator [Beijerinckiaceae bacterium RH CH11]VVB46979.1 DNA-binding response regulator [Beijerinckiaceae bacterium RH AL8]VVC55613.1 DNA-binding response regulator [Beijerinckiaceae bacterium RH AL1]